MFDIGFSELLLIAIITLVVMGPQRLPQTVRTASLWIGRLKRALGDAKRDFENEIGIDEVRRQLHNEKIMHDLKESKSDIQRVMDSANLEQSIKAPPTPQPTPPAADSKNDND